MRLALAALAVEHALAFSAFAEPALVATTSVIAGVDSPYSPGIRGNAMWLGGWSTAADPEQYDRARAGGLDADLLPGADKVFKTGREGEEWLIPALVFEKLGWHVNDPAVIEPAWAPSAAIEGETIWVHCHDGLARAWRQSLAMNGWQPLAPPEPLGLTLTNVEVARLDDGTWLMLANTPDLHDIVQLTSRDGRNWTLAQPLIRGGTSLVLAPAIDASTPGRLRVYFGVDQDGTGSHSGQMWKFAL